MTRIRLIANKILNIVLIATAIYLLSAYWRVKKQELTIRSNGKDVTFFVVKQPEGDYINISVDKDVCVSMMLSSEGKELVYLYPDYYIKVPTLLNRRTFFIPNDRGGAWVTDLDKTEPTWKLNVAREESNPRANP